MSFSSQESGGGRRLDPEQKSNLIVALIIIIPLVLLVGYFAFVLGLRDIVQQCPPHCDEADYARQDLTGADLSGLSLQSANFTGPDLSGSIAELIRSLLRHLRRCLA